MKARLLWIFGAAAALVVGGATVSRLALAGPKVEVGRPCALADRPGLAAVDHSAFDTLLQKHVDDRGLVAYAKWKAEATDLQALDEYLAQVGCVDLAKPAPATARLAYWINVYNALTIKGILREYPTSSIRNHTASLIGYNIWKDLCLWVDGRYYSLDDMEHGLLRKMGEPRIHFGLVCASKGCPPLINRAYTAENVEALLTANARRFFAQPANFRADSSTRTVHLSQLIQWYGKDFAATPAEQLQALRPYFPSPERLDWIEAPDVRVKYLPYDWGLNDRYPVSR